MRYSISKFIISMLVLFVALAFCNRWLLKHIRVVYGPLHNTQASLFSFGGQVREWTTYVVHWHSLATQVESLTKEKQELKGQLVELDSLQYQKEFLEKALGVSRSLDRSIIPGGIYALQTDASSHVALINKGSEERVAKGDIVITSNQVLVGQVSEVYLHNARVMLTDDPAMKVSVRISGSQVHGITQGALHASMNLQLIVQTDQIQEGDTLVSNGDDFFPAGLIVGTVRQIQENETQLFKQVSLVPAFDGGSGSILIIH